MAEQPGTAPSNLNPKLPNRGYAHATLSAVVFHIPVVPKMPQVVHGWPYHRTRDFLMVGKRCEQGKTLICPCSLRFTRLSQSEKVGDPPQGRPTGSNPRTSARSRAADPRWYETCGREGKALVWGCARARHACGSVRRTRRLDARHRHAGIVHRVRKEQCYATERRDDAWGGGHRP
jgi:hypothetical protein